jgi:endonuclease I
MKSSQLILRAAAAAAVATLCASRTARAQYEAPNPVYAAPASYYNTATGTGATLKFNLNEIIDGHTLRTYGSTSHDAAMRKLDEDPNNPNNVTLIYNGASVAKADVLNTTYNREHMWCNSYGLDDTNYAYSDLFNLRVCDGVVNSDRNNNYYDNGGGVANAAAPDCREVENVSWEPRAIEKGDIARAMFYMDTRYEGQANDNFPRDLQLVGTKDLALITTSNNYMGNLDTLLRWNYEDGISNWERRRNHLIYTSDTGPNGWNGTANNQGNRNPFVDHPEWVWTLFGGGNNNSQIKLAGGTANADGSSSVTANLRVMKGGTFGTTTVALNKTGVHPTTLDITAAGAATTPDAGPGQTFAYDPQTRSITVGVTGSTATTGARTGTITIDNTDLTTGGAGLGSSDGNDTINVVGQVVDNRVITASAVSFGRVIIGTDVTANTTLSSPGSDDHNTRVTVTGAPVSADGNGVRLGSGIQTTFNGTTTTAGRSVTGNFTSAGSKSGSRSFVVQGEGLAGETPNPVSVSYTATALDHAGPSFDPVQSSTMQEFDFGYVPIGFATRTASFTVYNRASAAGAALTAGLVVTGASGEGHAGMSISVTPSDPGAPLPAGSATGYTYSASFQSNGSAGEKIGTYAIEGIDENLPGAQVTPDIFVDTVGRSITDGTFPATGFINLFAGESFDTGAGAIAAGVTLTKLGAGALNFTGAQAHGTNSTLIAGGGSVAFNTDAGSPAAANLAVQSNAGATVTFSSGEHLRGLTVSGGNANVSPGGDKTIVTNNLSVTGGGKLDLANNALVVRGGNAGSLTGSTYDGIAGLVQTGRAGGAWNGAGINTRSASGASATTALGIARAVDVVGAEGGTFAGESVAASDVLVRYTWAGDANLDLKVDGDDYFAIDSHVGGTGAGIGWSTGDFDYNGLINGDDYFYIDSNAGAFGAPPTGPVGSFAEAGGIAAVPEPASIAFAALGAAGTLLRRRRR